MEGAIADTEAEWAAKAQAIEPVELTLTHRPNRRRHRGRLGAHGRVGERRGEGGAQARRRKVARGVFFGWAVVVAALVMMTTSAGLGFYNLTVYLRALVVEHGFSVGAVSGPTSVFFLSGGVAGIPIAALIKRYDARLIVTGGAIAAAAALLLLGRVTTIMELYLDYALFGVGFTASCLLPATTVVTRWFERRRAFALSVALIGISLGGIVITPLSAALITSRGLAAVTPWLAALYLVGVVPITVLLLRPDPAGVGLRPDGASADEASADQPPRGTSFGAAVRSRFFIGVTVAFVLAFGAQVGGIAHLFNLVSERADEQVAAIAVSSLAAAAITGRLAGGWIVSKMSMRGFTGAMLVGQGLGLLGLAFASGSVPLLVTSVAFGLIVGNVLMLHPLLLAEAFGVREYPRIYAMSQLLATLGFAFGPALVGILHDESGAYTLAFSAAACASAVSLAVLLASVPPAGAGDLDREPIEASGAARA
jgi:MFS family permease